MRQLEKTCILLAFKAACTYMHKAACMKLHALTRMQVCAECTVCANLGIMLSSLANAKPILRPKFLVFAHT